MEKYVVEAWSISEDDNGKKTKTFEGFWHDGDHLETPMEKGLALVHAATDKGHFIQNYTGKFVQGQEVIIINLDGMVEFRIIPESQSKHLGGGVWNAQGD